MRILVLVLVIVFTGCNLVEPKPLGGTPDSSDGKLTVEKAQRTVNKIKGTYGALTVKGIREVPAQNIAIADMQFVNERLDPSMDSRTESYNGPGYAVFSHYSDGRWVLTTYGRGNGSSAFSLKWTTNIEVK